MAIAVSLVVSFWTTCCILFKYIHQKLRLRVEAKHEEKSDENTAGKLSDITLQEANKSILKVNNDFKETDASCTLESGASCFASGAKSGSQEIAGKTTSTDNDESKSKTDIDTEKMPARDSTTITNEAEPLAKEQSARAAASTSTATFSYSFTFSGQTIMQFAINKSNEKPQGMSDANAESEKQELSLANTEGTKGSSNISDIKAAADPMVTRKNMVTKITGSTSITTSAISQSLDSSTLGTVEIIQSEIFASAVQCFAQNLVSAMKATLLSASASSWTASRSNEPVTFIDRSNIKDSKAEDLTPSVNDNQNESAPMIDAKNKVPELSQVGINDIPAVAENPKEPAATTAQTLPLMFRFISQKSTGAVQSGPGFRTNSSKIFTPPDVKSAGLFPIPKYEDFPRSQKVRPVFRSATQASSLRQNKSKPGFRFCPPASSAGENKPTSAFSLAFPANSLVQSKLKPGFNFCPPASSAGQNKPTSAFSLAFPADSSGQNKSTLGFSFADPASSLGENKSTPVFGLPTSDLKFTTGFKFADSVHIATSVPPGFSGLAPDTAPAKGLGHDTTKQSSTITSSCNAKSTSNFTNRRAPTASK